MANLSVDLSHFPLVILTLDGPQDAEDAKVYTDAIDEVLARQQPYAVLHRINQFGSSLAAARIIATWSLKNTKALRQYCLGGAVIVQSETFRFLLSSFQLITPLPAPVELVKTEEAGLLWIHQKFAERGVRFAGI